jgi:hypothetical protein
MVSQEYLKSILRYEPETGKWFWRSHRNSRVRAGDEAGYIRKDGYVIIRIDGATYVASRLAWLYVHGTSPHEVDHRDTNPSNNRANNLREATRSQNGANKTVRRDNILGLKGVSYMPSKRKFRARVTKDRKEIHIGLFATPEEAHAAYVERSKQLHGEFARAG